MRCAGSLRRLSPDVRIDTDEIRAVLLNEVLKREVVEGEKAQEAARKLSRAANRALRAKAARAGDDNATQEPATPE